MAAPVCVAKLNIKRSNYFGVFNAYYKKIICAATFLSESPIVTNFAPGYIWAKKNCAI